MQHMCTVASVRLGSLRLGVEHAVGLMGSFLIAHLAQGRCEEKESVGRFRISAIYICMCIYIYVCIYTYVCIYIYICIQRSCHTQNDISREKTVAKRGISVFFCFCGKDTK